MATTHEEPKVQSFYRQLQERVSTWLESKEAAAMPRAGLYRHLPELFVFLTRIALDPRVPDRERSATMSSLKYIVAPFDLIPEGLVGTAGFRDDLVLAALVVERLDGRVPPDVLRAHWSGADDPMEVARVILDAGDEMVGPEVYRALRDWLPR